MLMLRNTTRLQPQISKYFMMICHVGISLTKLEINMTQLKVNGELFLPCIHHCDE